MVIILAILMVILLNNLASELQRSPTYYYRYIALLSLRGLLGGHGGGVVTLSPPSSEAGVWFPAWPQVGQVVVACRCLAIYSTEP